VKKEKLSLALTQWSGGTDGIEWSASCPFRFNPGSHRIGGWVAETVKNPKLNPDDDNKNYILLKN
jgi:hypothetical protein